MTIRIQEFLPIHGVGKAKPTRYAAAFLEVIQACSRAATTSLDQPHQDMKPCAGR